jgi:hypothetical protein
MWSNPYKDSKAVTAFIEKPLKGSIFKERNG